MKGSFDPWLRTAALGGMVAGRVLNGGSSQSISQVSQAPQCVLGQGTTCSNWFSFATLWALGIKPRSPGFATVLLAADPSCGPQCPPFFFQMEQVFSPYSLCIQLRETLYCLLRTELGLGGSEHPNTASLGICSTTLGLCLASSSLIFLPAL